jgi:hypothetical protein
MIKRREEPMRVARILLLGTTLLSGCLVERHHYRHDYYGHEYRCYGDECRERRYR